MQPTKRITCRTSVIARGTGSVETDYLLLNYNLDQLCGDILSISVPCEACYHLLWLCTRSLCCLHPTPVPDVLATRAHLPPVPRTASSRVRVRRCTPNDDEHEASLRVWDAFGTIESFWSAFFSSAQLVYIITTQATHSTSTDTLLRRKYRPKACTHT